MPRFELLSKDDVFELAANQFGVWDEALLLLAHVQHNAPEKIKSLWAQVVLQCIPRQTGPGCHSRAEVEQFIRQRESGESSLDMLDIVADRLKVT